MLQSVRLEDGTRAPITGPAAKLARTPIRVRSAAPALGAHTHEILAELGLGEDARRALRAAGVVASPGGADATSDGELDSRPD
jgi:formyl-CoA transferase